MRVSDYIAKFLYDNGVKDVFMLTGGGSIFLSDGVAQHPNLNGVFVHHEQAAAMAAVSYARYNNHFGATIVTTGCGGTNAITGLLGAWQDSTPSMFISGQVKIKDTTNNSDLDLRQIGVQELNIIKVVDSMTKYSVVVDNPQKIAFYLEKAMYLAKSGRPGPVWVDVPMDIQSAVINELTLEHFLPAINETKNEYKKDPTEQEMQKFYSFLGESKRPVVVAGHGVGLSGSKKELLSFVEKFNLPVVSPYLGIGTIPTDHDLFIGRLGAKGDRSGNFCIQNSDLVIVMGSRLDVSAIGYDYKNFAREAKIIVIDIDPTEHQKKGVKIDLFINADIKNFLNNINCKQETDRSWWTLKSLYWKKKWPVCLPEYSKETNGVNIYYFINRLSTFMPDDAVVVSDAGSAFYATSQAVNLKENQRYITSGAQAEMGYTLPACIGISIARNNGEVLGITGDGSLQLNIQELQTIVHNKLPIKLFVLNNDGYLSIRNTQTKYFESRFIGTDSTSGVSFPNLEKIASAYGIKYIKISNSQNVENKIKEIIKKEGPVICEVMCIRDQEMVPAVASYKKEDGTMVSRPLEDMYPFLERNEFYNEMIVEPIEKQLKIVNINQNNMENKMDCGVVKEKKTKKTIRSFNIMKKRGVPVSWITAYDFPFAYSAEQAGIDMILVGDSGGMVQLGYKTTNPVTMDEMITLSKAARKGAPNTFLVGDMPQGAYEISERDAVYNALRFVKEAGCDAIKCEGGVRIVSKVKAMINAGILVIGHLGLTPQSTASFGGYRVQGKDIESFEQTLVDAKALEDAGISILLLEAMPTESAAQIAKQLSIPVFGIGAGGDVDGQLIIMHDIMGFYKSFRPWFTKCYVPEILNEFGSYLSGFSDLRKHGIDTRKDGMLVMTEMAIKKYIQEVKSKVFPGIDYSYPIKQGQLDLLKKSNMWVKASHYNNL